MEKESVNRRKKERTWLSPSIAIPLSLTALASALAGEGFWQTLAVVAVVAFILVGIQGEKDGCYD